MNLKSFRYCMWVEGTDWHAIERDGRWEIYDGDRLVDYADNDAVAQAKLMYRAGL